MGEWDAAVKHYEVAASFKTGGNVPSLAKSRLEERETETVRRLRQIRGLTRQRGKALEAARGWRDVRAEVEAGRASADVSIDVIRFRQGLCYEEAEEYERAREAYGSVQTTQDLAVRSKLGMARCYVREGNLERGRALLDSLESDASFPGRALAGRALRALNGASCESKATGPAEGGRLLVYRDPEAWSVSMQYETDQGEACLPMTFSGGVWQCRLPLDLPARRYYFRVDLSRREPDPLAAWEMGDQGLPWSLTEASGAERAKWSQRVDR
jgi:hypothetical protein